MSFEDFDQQINDAADKHHPEYREEAWGKMEQLLDKHLPQSKQRKRRALLLLPLLLLLGAGGYFLTNLLTGTQVLSDKAKPISNEADGNREQGTANGTPATSNLQPVTRNQEQVLSDKAKPISNGGTGNSAPITSNQQPVTGNQQPVTRNQEQVLSDKAKPVSNGGTRNQELGIEEQVVSEKAKPVSKGAGNGTPVTSNQEQVLSDKAKPISNGRTGNAVNPSRKKIPASKQLKPTTGNETTEESGSNPGINPLPLAEEKIENIMPPVALEETPVKTNNDTESSKPQADLDNDSKKDTPGLPAKKETAKKNNKRNGFGNALAITFSAGMDMSAVRFSNPGNKRIITGAGLQYQLTKNFAVRAGIFQTNKVYGAQPQDYHSDYVAPAGSVLVGVDGDCRVFEIPVSIAYTFNPGKKLNFFAAAGASSMIMKEEDYVYNYKTNYGLFYKSDYGVKNQNQHLFASIDLSAGVERQFTNRFFFRAEPYLRLPLQGVGVGNIKLKSAGILLTAGFKPFAKK